MKTKIFLLFFVIILSLCFAGFAEAGVYITKATGGENISLDSIGGDWTTLLPIVIMEGTPGDIGLGDIILVIPEGFEINTQRPPGIEVSGGTELLAHFTSVSSNQIKITVTQVSATTSHTLTIGRINQIQIRPTSSNLPQGSIYTSTSIIQGVAFGTNGTSFGDLKTVSALAPQEPPSQEPSPPILPPQEKPISEMTEAELKAKIIEVQQEIVELLARLIQLLQSKILGL